MVKNLLKLSYLHPKLVLLLLVLITAAAAPLLERLHYDISAQSLITKSSPAWDAYQRMLEEFGSDSTVIILMSDEKLYTRDKLLKIREVLKKLEALPFVKASSSLFNAPNVKEVDGYIQAKPFLEELPKTLEEARKLIDEALANPLVERNLVSPDRRTMAINLSIDESQSQPGHDKLVTDAIEEALQPLKSELDTVFQMSAAFVREQISEQLQVDQRYILPASLLVLIVVLGMSMGRLNCSIVPMSTSIISIVLTLAFMAWMEIPMNVLNSIIPALLIVIGSTEDVHLMSEYHIGIRQGLTRDEAVARLPAHQSMAVLLAFITTFAGFVSITVNDIDMLSQFGWLVSLGLFINFVVTALFVPAYLRLFGGTGKGLEERNLYQKLSGALFSVVMRFKKTTLLLVLLVAGYYAWGAQYLQVNNNTLAYFAENSPVVQRAEQIHQKLSGMQTFSIVLESPVEGTFQKVKYLEEMARIQDFIASRKLFDKSFSFADFIKLTHQVMDETDQPELPDEDELVQVYMEFVQFDVVKAYVTPGYDAARILVRHNVGDSSVLKKEFAAIRSFIEEYLKSPLKITLTGDSVLNSDAADAMATGQIQSLLLMVVVILLLVSLLFIDLRAGVIALIPNLFPVVVLFGVMGYYGIPLDTGTTMVAVIAIGICVDDTIHFLSRYHANTRGTSDVVEALRLTLEHEATPITTTSIALALGFATLMLSSFRPVVYFGALSSLVMILAMFSTFILTPVLLSFTKLITVWDMMALDLKADLLSKSKLFRGLKGFQVKQAVLSGTIRQYRPGEVIIDQGNSGDEFFVLLEGTATATHRSSDGSVHTLAFLRPGDLFGEVAQLSERKRMARVTANETVRVLEMRWDSIRQLGRWHPRIAMKLYRNLAEILSERLTTLSQEPTQTRDELTGALTKPYLCEIFQQEFKRSRYFSEPMSLMLLEINIDPIEEAHCDTRECEQVLRRITALIQETLRPTDVFARWGDKSFMVLLPRTHSEQAVKLAEKLQRVLEEAELTDKAHLHISVTVTEARKSDGGRQALDRLEEQMEKLRQSRKSLQLSIS